MSTLIFDTWGTLVDNYSVAEHILPYVHRWETAMEIAVTWRKKQKSMLFYLSLAEHHLPPTALTEAALRYALEKHHFALSNGEIARIMAGYTRLRPFPDVPLGLKRLKDDGHRLVIVANPTKEMLETTVINAGIRQFFAEIISSGDEAKIYKPSLKVYELGISRVGVPKEEVFWVTSHFWEIVGADRYGGIKTCYVNRARLPLDPVGVQPDITVHTMDQLAAAIRSLQS